MSIQDFIDDFLSQVLRDFKSHIEPIDSICSLKKLNYENTQMPDYRKAIMREYYLLRYFYAYFTEYYHIYRKMIRESHLKAPLSVASIGCGAGIDYYSLNFAVPHSLENFTYQGVDLIDWGFRGNNSQTCFLQTNISDISLQDINVLMFPKSLSEFSEDDFNTFVDNLRPQKFQDTICIVSSMMNEGGEYDIERIKILEKKLCQYDYQSLNNSDKTYAPKAESCYRVISARCPDCVTEYLSQLKDLCNQTASQCATCQINKSPILRTEHIRYQTLFLTKAGAVK